MIESTPPKLTKEERLAALEAAKVARVKRAEVKKKLASGEMSVEEAISMKDDEIVGRLKVVDMIEAVRGFGSAKSEKLMKEIGIAKNRRLKGLGWKQAKELIDRFRDGTELSITTSADCALSAYHRPKSAVSVNEVRFDLSVPALIISASLTERICFSPGI